MLIVTALLYHSRSFARHGQALFAILLLIATLVTSTPSPVAGAEQPDHTYHVLILNSYHQGFRWTDDIVAAVMATLSAGLTKVEYHIEYMDSKRCLDEKLDKMILQMLVLKYKLVLPDIIITSDDSAFDFMKRYHNQLFPNVPVVFCGVNNSADALAVDRKYFTGLVEALDIPANIALIRHLLPKVNRIVVVSDGTPTGIGTRQMVVAAARGYPGITFTYLNGEALTTDEMLAKLRRLKATSAVIAPDWYLDREGNTFDNKAIYPRIAKASPVPVFGTSSANLGLGIIGGKVNSGTIQGEYAAKQALRILTGQVSIKDLPVETTSQNRYQFDDRQLIRFSIDERLLPPGSRILFRPFSFYHTYKHLVFIVFSVFCLFAFLIVFLFLNSKRLRLSRNNLGRSEEKLRVTLNSIGDAVITTDTNGHISSMNPIAETLTGWLETEAYGRPLEEVFNIVNATSKAKCADTAAIVLSTGKNTTLAEDTLLVSKNSTEYRIADSCASIRNDAGEVLGAVLVFRDITTEYLREAQLKQAQKMGAVGRLAGGVAHDFNNMLSVIMGHAELAMMRCLPSDPTRSDLKTIQECVSRSADLVRQLLAFARQQTVAPKVLDLNATVANMLKMIQRLIGEDIDLVWHPGSGEMLVKIDPSQIDQLLANLCVNARDAIIGVGKITIETQNVIFNEAYCSIHHGFAPGEYVMLAVSDNGCGMDKETVENIFEPFFTTKDLGKGTGLGLATVYGIVRQNNGFINVYSEPENGTAIKVYVPRHIGGVVDPQDVSMEEIPKGRGEMVLLVEDEEAILNVGKIMLAELGYKVVACSAPSEARRLAEIHNRQIQLLITDVIMPEMNGHDLSKMLCKINPGLKCLFSSGYTADVIAHRGVLDEGVNFLQKPYSIRDLAVKVRTVLEHE